MAKRAGRRPLSSEVLGLTCLAAAAVMLFVDLTLDPPQPTPPEETAETLESAGETSDPYFVPGLVLLRVGVSLSLAQGMRSGRRDRSE